MKCKECGKEIAETEYDRYTGYCSKCFSKKHPETIQREAMD